LKHYILNLWLLNIYIQWNFARSNSKVLSKYVRAIGSSSHRGPVILDRKKSCSDPGQFHYLYMITGNVKVLKKLSYLYLNCKMFCNYILRLYYFRLLCKIFCIIFHLLHLYICVRVNKELELELKWLNIFYEKGQLELRSLELEGTVKICSSYRKFEPLRFRNIRQKKILFWPGTVSLPIYDNWCTVKLAFLVKELTNGRFRYKFKRETITERALNNLHFFFKSVGKHLKFQPQMLSECTILHLFVKKISRSPPPYRFWNNKGWHVCMLLHL
jgi:hypothetical protein